MAPLSQQFSIELLSKPEGKLSICRFLTEADISIADIDVVSKKVSEHIRHVCDLDHIHRVY
jgi:hypothetical protein